MSLINNIYYNIVPFVLVLSILVFIHELGHYLAARWNKVKVDVFSIGFGAELFGWTDRLGTRWKVSLVPLGGYVKMASDLNAASQPDTQMIEAMTDEEKEGSLYHKTVWQRIAISAAGPAANYLFAILVFGLLYIFSGQKIPSDQAKIGQVMPGSVAFHSGFQGGDLVTAANHQPVQTFVDMQKVIQANVGKEVTFDIQRNNETMILKAIPEAVGNAGNKVGRIGVVPSFDQVKRSPFTAFYYAITEIYHISATTVSSIGNMIIGQQSTDGLSGPLGIAKITGQIAQRGFIDLIWLSALLSINLGLINLFPIPMLDGGHLLFYFIEAIRGRPVPEKIQEWGYRIGFAIVIALMVISTWNDLQNLKVFEFFKKFFN